MDLELTQTATPATAPHPHEHDPERPILAQKSETAPRRRSGQSEQSFSAPCFPFLILATRAHGPVPTGARFYRPGPSL